MTGEKGDVDPLASLALHLQDMLCVDRHPTLVKTYSDVSRLLTVQYTPAFANKLSTFDGIVDAIRSDPWDVTVAQRFHDLVDTVWHGCHEKDDRGSTHRLQRGWISPILIVLGVALWRRRARSLRQVHPRLQR